MEKLGRKMWACPEWFENEGDHQDVTGIYLMFWKIPPSDTHREAVTIATDAELKQHEEALLREAWEAARFHVRTPGGIGMHLEHDTFDDFLKARAK